MQVLVKDQTVRAGWRPCQIETCVGFHRLHGVSEGLFVPIISPSTIVDDNIAAAHDSAVKKNCVRVH